MILRAALPKELIASNFKRHNSNCQGGQVPICFVPEGIPPSEEKQGKAATVKFKISPTIRKTHKVLLKGCTEAFINHIKIHKTILSDISVDAEAVVASMVQNRYKLEDLTVADPVTNQTKRMMTW